MQTDLQRMITGHLEQATDGEWLAYIRFFQRQLLTEQEFLLDLIDRRTELRAAVHNRQPDVSAGLREKRTAFDFLPPLLAELQLRLTLCPNRLPITSEGTHTTA